MEGLRLFTFDLDADVLHLETFWRLKEREVRLPVLLLDEDVLTVIDFDAVALGLSLAASASRTSFATLFSARPLFTFTRTLVESPWRGVTRNTMSPLLVGCPSISMRHLLAVGALSANDAAANDIDEASADGD